MCNFYQGITTHKNAYDFVTINPIEVVSTKQAMKPAGSKLLRLDQRLEDLTIASATHLPRTLPSPLTGERVVCPPMTGISSTC